MLTIDENLVGDIYILMDEIKRINPTLEEINEIINDLSGAAWDLIRYRDKIKNEVH